MSSQRMSSDSERLAQDGFVVLPNVVSDELTGALLKICEKTLERKNRVRTWLPMELHRRYPMQDIHRIVRRAVGSVLEPILGAPLRVKECWIRSARPDGKIQSVHRDGTFLAEGGMPEMTEFTADILLTDYSEENGGTELWPGSHLIPDFNIDDLKKTDERANSYPSRTVTASKGSLVIRDPRVWHRAQMNRTNASRLMVSIIYEAQTEV